MTNRSLAAPIKVVFIGNSFTAWNDVPGLIAQLAEARGHQLQQRLIQAGGASLRMHWNKGDAPREIREGNYYYVMLQEQSTLPVRKPLCMHENIRLFDEVIKASGSKTALYLTWDRQNASETQPAINNAYTTISEELGARVVPVGIAWQNFLRKHDKPVLHDNDQSHPALAGSYMATGFFFAVLFGESSVDIAGNLKGLSQAELGLLQRTA